jgi:hypothetical protein
MLKWRDLWLLMKMPKIHGLEDHLIVSMEQWNGIGNFLEDFIEAGASIWDEVGNTNSKHERQGENGKFTFKVIMGRQDE